MLEIDSNIEKKPKKYERKNYEVMCINIDEIDRPEIIPIAIYSTYPFIG